MIVRRIELACLGRLMIRGNYQCICPDPYAYMEWICYRDTKPINGLLKAGEAYCWYWNQQEKVPEYVDAMRSPLTHFSEHGIDKLSFEHFFLVLEYTLLFQRQFRFRLRVFRTLLVKAMTSRA